MTVYDVFYRLDLMLDKANSGAFPDLTQKQREEFIEKAINKYIVEMYSQGFEVAEVLTSKLKDFVFYDTLYPTTEVVPSLALTSEYTTTSYAVPIKLWFSIYESVDISDSCGTRNVAIKAAKHDDISNRIRDPFNKPTKLDILRVLQGRYIKVIHPIDTATGKLSIGYIGKVNPLVLGLTYTKENWKELTYWLSDVTVDDILSIAVMLALETFESPRLKSFAQIK